MYRVIFLLLLLAACAAKPNLPVHSFRAASVPIYSNAVLEIDRLAGNWHQVAAFAAPGSGDCAPAGVKIGTAPGGLSVAGALCLSGQVVPVNGPLAPAGPGRFALRGADPQGIGQVWWVLWADVGYRTLAIGTPSGAFGFILNRDGPLPSDRAVAAREVLDFNGYDTSRLAPVPVSR